MKKLLIAVLVLAVALPLFAATKEEAIKALLPDAGAVTAYKLTPEQITKIQTALNSKMAVRTDYELYVTASGVVVLEEQMGKWAKVYSAVLIDPATKKVKAIEIYNHQEKRGAGIKTSAFLNQFAGKASSEIGEVGKGVRGVSGATISAKAVALSVKRALLVYEEYAAK